MGWVFARAFIPTGTKTSEEPTNLKIPSPRLLKVLPLCDHGLLRQRVNVITTTRTTAQKTPCVTGYRARWRMLFCFSESEGSTGSLSGEPMRVDDWTESACHQTTHACLPGPHYAQRGRAEVSAVQTVLVVLWVRASKLLALTCCRQHSANIVVV